MLLISFFLKSLQSLSMPSHHTEPDPYTFPSFSHFLLLLLLILFLFLLLAFLLLPFLLLHFLPLSTPPHLAPAPSPTLPPPPSTYLLLLLPILLSLSSSTLSSSSWCLWLPKAWSKFLLNLA